MVTPAFKKMQRSLIDRGLLTADLQITPAGNAWLDQQLVELREAQADALPEGHKVIQWKGWMRGKTHDPTHNSEFRRVA